MGSLVVALVTLASGLRVLAIHPIAGVLLALGGMGLSLTAWQFCVEPSQQEGDKASVASEVVIFTEYTQSSSITRTYRN
jgi:hypothetical protein